MSESNVFKSSSMGHESMHKFDYFITGCTGAIFSYLINHITPEKFGYNYFTINILSLLMLLGSIIFGFKRLESHHVYLFVNSSILKAYEKAGIMRQLIEEDKDGFDALTGEKYLLKNAPKKFDYYQEKISELNEKLIGVGDRSLSFYNYRNILLISGFSLLIVSKILQPYM